MITLILTLKKLENTSLTVVSTIPHTHTTGISVYTKIVRNGNDIGYILDNEHYDFNYQVFSITHSIKSFILKFNRRFLNRLHIYWIHQWKLQKLVFSCHCLYCKYMNLKSIIYISRTML